MSKVFVTRVSEEDSESLKHYGVKGMKWGKRKSVMTGSDNDRKVAQRLNSEAVKRTGTSNPNELDDSELGEYGVRKGSSRESARAQVLTDTSSKEAQKPSAVRSNALSKLYGLKMANELPSEKDVKKGKRAMSRVSMKTYGGQGYK